MTLSENSAEDLRRREVSRLFRRLSFSTKEAEAIESLSRSLVGELLDGPIRETLLRPGIQSVSSHRTERTIRL